MKIAFLASECAPYLKTGGLGDVVQALPEALSKLPKVEVSVFLPYYSRIKYSGQWKTDFLGYFDVQLAWRREYVGIFRLKTRKKKLQVYFLDNEQYFNRPSPTATPTTASGSPTSPAPVWSLCAISACSRTSSTATTGRRPLCRCC